jgi:flavin reductase (DIM6/NTAB) family NADH-FMN oxidoreductase RutF
MFGRGGGTTPEEGIAEFPYRGAAWNVHAATLWQRKAREGACMKTYQKHHFPVSDIRRLIEPGPIVLVSSRDKGAANVMTMGWHTVMEFTPSLIGCVIAGGSHSHAMIRRSRQCVINVPTADIASTVVRIGNCSGADTDKFAKFRLTAQEASEVNAPLIAECYASLECRLSDAALVDKYDFFIFEVVKAHVARSPKNPKTIHYRGDGDFMIAGTTKSYRRLFRPGMV